MQGVKVFRLSLLVCDLCWSRGWQLGVEATAPRLIYIMATKNQTAKNCVATRGTASPLDGGLWKLWNVSSFPRMLFHSDGVSEKGCLSDTFKKWWICEWCAEVWFAPASIYMMGPCGQKQEYGGSCEHYYDGSLRTKKKKWLLLLRAYYDGPCGTNGMWGTAKETSSATYGPNNNRGLRAKGRE